MEANNMKALREACCGLCSAAFHVILAYGNSSDLMQRLACEVDKARLALDKPPRNCDVGTAEEQKKRFSKFCTEHTDPMDIDGWQCDKKCPLYKNHPDCQFAWAQMPHESEVKGG